MSSIGLNVARDGRHDPALIRGLGATWIRIVALPDLDLSDYFRRCRSAGLKILLVLARESGGDYAALAARYATLVDAWQVGNEADHVSPSSWTMQPSELAALGRSARAILPRPHVLVCAGMASGHPEWMAGMDLSWADAVAVSSVSEGRAESRRYRRPPGRRRADPRVRRSDRPAGPGYGVGLVVG
jgi:hypothetical protein